MTIQKFGVWEVTTSGMTAKVLGEYPYFIEKKRLWEVIQNDGIWMWDWVVHLGGKDWLTHHDLANFNQAFTFAQEHFIKFMPLDLPKVSWRESVRIQAKNAR